MVSWASQMYWKFIEIWEGFTAVGVNACDRDYRTPRPLGVAVLPCSVCGCGAPV